VYGPYQLSAQAPPFRTPGPRVRPAAVTGTRRRVTVWEPHRHAEAAFAGRRRSHVQQANGEEGSREREVEGATVDGTEGFAPLC
jgi:hypothetical protein